MGVLLVAAILLIAGFILGIPILWTLGIIVGVIGLILLLVGVGSGGSGYSRYGYGRWW